MQAAAAMGRQVLTWFVRSTWIWLALTVFMQELRAQTKPCDLLKVSGLQQGSCLCPVSRHQENVSDIQGGQQMNRDKETICNILATSDFSCWKR